MRQLKINPSVTPRSTQSIDSFLAEIAKIDLISAEEEVILAEKIKSGDQNALEKLTNANLRFVVSVAKQYQNQWLSLPDLINEGNLWLIKAAQRFDTTRGFKFISYAVWRIRQSIMQALADNQRMIRLPLNKIWQINKLKKAIESLEQKLERTPTAEEIAKVLQIDIDKVEELLWMTYMNPLILDRPLVDNESDTLLDVLSNDENPTDHDVSFHEWLRLELQRAFTTLTMRERDILLMYFGIGRSHELTLDEIAEKLELTRERVRQIKERAITKLKRWGRAKLLKPYFWW